MVKIISVQTTIILVVVLVAAQMVQGQRHGGGGGAGLGPNNDPLRRPPYGIMDVISRFRRHARGTSAVDKVKAILEANQLRQN